MATDKNLTEKEQPEIKRMRFIDIPRVVNFYKRETTKEFRPYILNKPLIFYIAFMFGKILGFLAIEDNKIVGICFIRYFSHKGLGILVAEQYRNRGIGKMLVDKIIDMEEDVYFSVEKGKIPIIALCKKCGFKIVRTSYLMKK